MYNFHAWQSYMHLYLSERQKKFKYIEVNESPTAEYMRLNRILKTALSVYICHDLLNTDNIFVTGKTQKVMYFS